MHQSEKIVCIVNLEANGSQKILMYVQDNSDPDEKPESYLSQALDLVEKSERAFFENVQIRWKRDWAVARAHRLKNLSTRIMAKFNIHRRPRELSTTRGESVRVVEELHSEDQHPPPEALKRDQSAEPTNGESTNLKSSITRTSLIARPKPIAEPGKVERALPPPAFARLPERVEKREIIVMDSNESDDENDQDNDENDSNQEQSPKDNVHPRSPPPIPALRGRKKTPSTMEITPVSASPPATPRKEQTTHSRAEFKMNISPAPPLPSSSFSSSCLPAPRKERITRSGSAQPVLEGRGSGGSYHSALTTAQRDTRDFHDRASSPEPPQAPNRPKYPPSPSQRRNRSHGDRSSPLEPEYDEQITKDISHKQGGQRRHESQGELHALPSRVHELINDNSASSARGSRNHRLSLPSNEHPRRPSRSDTARRASASGRLRVPLDDEDDENVNIRQLGRDYRVRSASDCGDERGSLLAQLGRNYRFRPSSSRS